MKQISIEEAQKRYGPHPIHANNQIATPRFATYEDAMLFMDCLAASKQYPQEKWIYPYKQLPNGDAIVNPEYANAPYELTYLIDKTPTVVDA